MLVEAAKVAVMPTATPEPVQSQPRVYRASAPTMGATAGLLSGLASGLGMLPVRVVRWALERSIGALDRLSRESGPATVRRKRTHAPPGRINDSRRI